MFKELRQLTGRPAKSAGALQHESRLQEHRGREKRDSRCPGASHPRDQHDRRGGAPYAGSRRAIGTARRAHAQRKAATLVEAFETFKSRATGTQGYEGVLQSIEGLAPL